MASVAEATATMVKNIEASTGLKMAEWLRRARAAGFTKHGEILKWLKEQHGIGHGYANYIAKAALADDEADEDSLVTAQYAGKKAALMPLYEALLKVVESFGSDVEIAPKKNNVSIRRSKQFALLQPSTADRLDVGLILQRAKTTPRLEASGSFNPMFTHRVRLKSKSDIDAELKAWLRQAYSEA
jgi:Domain of unknown function (DUF5655)/Domain of unknown function (DUF4287)